MTKYLKQWTFPSRSNPDKSYKVSMKENGELICHCWPYLNLRQPCQHIEAVERGDVTENGQPIEKRIVLAQVCQVMLGEDGDVMTPLMPVGDTWFQASLIYDLLRAGISWAEIRERYMLAKANSQKAIVAFVQERGRRVYHEIVAGFGQRSTYAIILADDPLPIYNKSREGEIESR